MAIVVTPNVTNVGAPMSSNDLLAQFNKGREIRQADLTNQFNTFQQRFLLDEPQRWVLLTRATDTSNPEDAKVAQAALDAEKAQMLTTYQAFNKATGGRMSDADVAKYVDNYWTRYDWRAGAVAPKKGQAEGDKKVGGREREKSQDPTGMGPGVAGAQLNSTGAGGGALNSVTPDGNPVPSVAYPGTDAKWELGLIDDLVAKLRHQELIEGSGLSSPGDTPMARGDGEYGAIVTTLLRDPEAKPELYGLSPASAAIVEEYRKKRSAMAAPSATPAAASGVAAAGYGAAAGNPAVPAANVGFAAAANPTSSPTAAPAAKPAAAPVPGPFKDRVAFSTAAAKLPKGALDEWLKKNPGYALFMKDGKPYSLRNKATGEEVDYTAIPGFSAGAAVSGPTLAVIGDGDEREYVVPESKAKSWAEILMATGKAPNPADIPRFKGGGIVDPMEEYAEANRQPPYTAATQPTPTAPAGVSATDPRFATIGKKSPEFNAMEFVGKKFEAPESALSMPPGDATKPKVQKQKAAAEKAIKDKGFHDVTNIAKVVPEGKAVMDKVSSGFKDWFDSASPEEMALYTGMGEAAKYRDLRLNRASQEAMFNSELELKWKYYELQKLAAQGDEFSARIKPMLDYGIEILKSNQKAIDEKGLATVMRDNPTVADAVNLFTWVQNGKKWTTVPTGLFNLGKPSLVEDKKSGPVNTTGVTTGFDVKAATNSLVNEARANK